MTVVRLADFPHDEGAFYVNDWDREGQYAEFTLPRDHPLTNHLINNPRSLALIVASTDEVEWHISEISYTLHACYVKCQTRQSLAKQWTLQDQFLIDAGMVS